jgi:hypothetical protein
MCRSPQFRPTFAQDVDCLAVKTNPTLANLKKFAMRCLHQKGAIGQTFTHLNRCSNSQIIMGQSGHCSPQEQSGA